MRAKIALIPYWLRDNPYQLENSDHRWWFTPLKGFNTIIFIGPFVRTNDKTEKGKRIITIQTSSFCFSLGENLWNHLNKHKISSDDIDLYWHVMEAAATCRVTNLGQLRCPKVAVIGDTHHMKSPISSLITYLSSETFTHICCSHNQYNPFFAASLGLHSLDFPFCFPENYEENCLQAKNKSQILGAEVNYYGSSLSSHHLHRSCVVNQLMKCKADVIVHARSSFTSWIKKITRRQIVLTCSLNGTFSFQQFLPMLYECIVFTDPLSKSNWLGESLQDGKNVFIFHSTNEVIDKHLLIKKNEVNLDSISNSAQLAAAKGLRREDMFDKGNIIEVLGNRKQFTQGEYDLFNNIATYISINGLEKYIAIVRIFEDIQEHHRVNWKITAITHETDSDETKLLLSMLQILPRINYCDAYQHKPAASEDQIKINFSEKSSIVIATQKKLI